MRKNITQTATTGPDGWRHIEYDWYSRGIPPNVHWQEDVYLDSAYGFSAFNAREENAMTIGENSGCYDRATFVTGYDGHIHIGSFTIVNGATIISNHEVNIGNHCMLAWGAVITDSWLPPATLSRQERAALLQRMAADPARTWPAFGPPATVNLQDNCWVGFDAVILPGVTVGRSAIVGSKSVVYENVPAYAIVVGNPARVIRYLPQDDTEDKAKALLEEYAIKIPKQ